MELPSINIIEFLNLLKVLTILWLIACTVYYSETASLNFQGFGKWMISSVIFSGNPSFRQGIHWLHAKYRHDIPLTRNIYRLFCPLNELYPTLAINNFNFFQSPISFAYFPKIAIALLIFLLSPINFVEYYNNFCDRFQMFWICQRMEITSYNYVINQYIDFK